MSTRQFSGITYYESQFSCATPKLKHVKLSSFFSKILIVIYYNSYKFQSCIALLYFHIIVVALYSDAMYTLWRGYKETQYALYNGVLSGVVHTYSLNIKFILKYFKNIVLLKQMKLLLTITVPG